MKTRLTTLIILISLSLSPSAARADCVRAVRLSVGVPYTTDCPRVALESKFADELKLLHAAAPFSKGVDAAQADLLAAKDARVELSDNLAAAYKKTSADDRAAYESEKAAGQLKLWGGFAAGVLTVVVVGFAARQLGN